MSQLRLYRVSVLLCLSCLSSCSPKNKILKSHAEISSIAKSIETYRNEKGRVPSNDEGFDPMIKDGFLSVRPVDPWGVEYKYHLTYSDDGIRIQIIGSNATQELVFLVPKNMNGNERESSN